MRRFRDWETEVGKDANFERSGSVRDLRLCQLHLLGDWLLCCGLWTAALIPFWSALGLVASGCLGWLLASVVIVVKEWR